MDFSSRQQMAAAARRYRIERYLTEGGMGAIYLGKKLGPGGFEKEVVLKQLLPEYTARPEFRDLFFREAKISATLDHANIVHVFDLVQSDESLFIVMEYVRGADLRTIGRRARLRRGTLSPPGAIHIVLEILAGLGYAHTRRDAQGASLSIIHRDVSPSNILCSAQGEVKLSDFGIAKAATHSSLFYRVRGKVGYMSPEQARNEAIDHRTDLYSLAVCLWEALAGERLFVGDLTTPPEQLYGQAILPVSRKKAVLPTMLDAVLAKALAKRVEDRFQSAAEFAEALRRVAQRSGLLYSAPELAEHLRTILGSDPEQWLKEEAIAEPSDTQRLASQSLSLEGKEAASLGIVDDGGAARDVLSPRAVTGDRDFDLDSLLADPRDAAFGPTPPPRTRGRNEKAAPARERPVAPGSAFGLDNSDDEVTRERPRPVPPSARAATPAPLRPGGKTQRGLGGPGPVPPPPSRARTAPASKPPPFRAAETRPTNPTTSPPPPPSLEDPPTPLPPSARELEDLGLTPPPPLAIPAAARPTGRLPAATPWSTGSPSPTAIPAIQERPVPAQALPPPATIYRSVPEPAGTEPAPRAFGSSSWDAVPSAGFDAAPVAVAPSRRGPPLWFSAVFLAAAAAGGAFLARQVTEQPLAALAADPLVVGPSSATSSNPASSSAPAPVPASTPPASTPPGP